MRHRKTVVLSDQAFVEQKLRLPQVTLICVDTANPDLALRALNHSMRWISFGAAVLVTAPNHTLSPPPGLQIVANETISTVRDYSRFMLRDLLPYVDTSHCLVVQWDGYVLDPTMWRDKFMEFDYLGPIWERFRNDPRCSCTGGFTLRSRRIECRNDPAGDRDIPMLYTRPRASLIGFPHLLEPPVIAESAR